MFEHSVKVPRHYKVAANIFKKVSTEGGSVKTLLYDDKLRHFRTNVLFALITETIKHATDIDKIFESCKLFENETRLDPWLAKVLTSELLFGKKALPGKSKPEQTILSYKDQFEKYTTENAGKLKTEVTRRPRYVRVNTNLLTTSDAIRAFQDEGYRFIRCTSGPYDDYLKQIQNLSEYDFTQDYHVKTMFVFSSGTKLHEHELYLENKIVLQDKATAMAVHLLAPPAGSVVLDICAAPGMKTTQLAAYIRNTGKIYAVERNEKRFQTLCDFVSKTGSQCVQTIHKDALEIKRGEMDDVEYIILDPSCSGSGMDFCVHNYIESTRLAKLTSLQEKFLKHAMNAFPNAKRIVYSTCSLYSEENERVITNVVKTSRAKWRVQDVKELLKGNWNNFGSAMYGSMGTRCMYAIPESDHTTGFFLAVLDRDQKDMEKCLKNDNARDKNNTEEEIDEADNTETPKIKKNKRNKKEKAPKNTDHEDVVSNEENITNDNDVVVEKTSKKRNTKTNGELNENTESVVEETDSKHKKKKRKNDNDDEYSQKNVTEIQDDIAVESYDDAPKKKKGKHKEQNYAIECNPSTDDVVTEDTAVSKKKKKRQKDKDEEQFPALEEQETENEVTNKKKRKKSKEDINSMDCEVKEKKKKRIKEFS